VVLPECVEKWAEVMIAKPAMRRLLLVGIETVGFDCGGDDRPVGVDEFLAVQQRPGDVVDGLPVGDSRRRRCVSWWTHHRFQYPVR